MRSQQKVVQCLYRTRIIKTHDVGISLSSYVRGGIGSGVSKFMGYHEIFGGMPPSRIQN